MGPTSPTSRCPTCPLFAAGQVSDPNQSDEAEPERDVLDPARPGSGISGMGRWMWKRRFQDSWQLVLGKACTAVRSVFCLASSDQVCFFSDEHWSHGQQIKGFPGKFFEMMAIRMLLGVIPCLTLQRAYMAAPFLAALVTLRQVSCTRASSLPRSMRVLWRRENRRILVDGPELSSSN